MSTQPIIGWLVILCSFLIAAGMLFAAARSVGAKPVSIRRVIPGLAIVTAALQVVVWATVMICWMFAILIDIDWLPDRYFAWLFEALAAPWKQLWPFD